MWAALDERVDLRDSARLGGFAGWHILHEAPQASRP
jgi:hypothetical protein